MLVRLYSYTNATVQMLAKLGLTEDRFNAMYPADQHRMEDKVREMIKQQVENTSDKRAGMIIDKSARGLSPEQSERRLFGQSPQSAPGSAEAVVAVAEI